MSGKKKIPAYLHHKQRNRARVRIEGKFVQLPGKYGSKESKEAYRRLVDEYLADLHVEEIIKGSCLIVELMVMYIRFADGYYNSHEPANIRCALRPLRELYGRLKADELSPLKLEAVRQRMTEMGWTRQGINKGVNQIRRMFKWGVQKELLKVTTYQALAAVDPLKAGRCNAPESPPVTSATEQQIEAIKPHVLPVIWTMVQIQRASGMRPGEVCGMQGQYITKEKGVWLFSPTRHKNAWRGRDRRIWLGPRSQRLILPYLQADPTCYLFSPKRAMQAFWSEQNAVRKTKYYSREAKQKRGTRGERLRDFYTVNTYAAAVRRACDKAEIKPWSPNQLRHSKGEEVRGDRGIEAASAVLGNTIDAAEIYAPSNERLARELAMKCG